MERGMTENLKHYLALIKWRLNKEKTMEMNERIFEALKRTEEEKGLPTIGEITALRESAQALEQCYRRLKRARTLCSVWRLLEDQHRLKSTHAYHGELLETPDWYEDLHSPECWFGYSFGIVIVAVGEDANQIFTGYCKAPAKKEEAERFGEFVRKQDPSVFDGTPNPYWFSYASYQQGDGTRSEDAVGLADKVQQMCQKMERLVAKFNEPQ
jgi:hypothetical protein